MINLEGKCKDEFGIYFFNKYGGHIGNSVTGSLVFFYSMPEAMQSGVYLEFFDSVGIKIEVQLLLMPKMDKAMFRGFKSVLFVDGRLVNVQASYQSRQEALKEAITKANEIYNK